MRHRQLSNRLTCIERLRAEAARDRRRPFHIASAHQWPLLRQGPGVSRWRGLVALCMASPGYSCSLARQQLSADLFHARRLRAEVHAPVAELAQPLDPCGRAHDQIDIDVIELRCLCV